jgi:hypothetical protein
MPNASATVVGDGNEVVAVGNYGSLLLLLLFLSVHRFLEFIEVSQ